MTSGTKTATMPRNTVQTVFSQETIGCIETLTHWFWDDTEWCDNPDMASDLMKMLSRYAADDLLGDGPPASRMATIIGDILALTGHLCVATRDEHPNDWEWTQEGYAKPTKGNQDEQ